MLNRRSFITNFLSGAAGASLLGTNYFSLPNATDTDDLWFDFHCHPGLFPARGSERYGGDGSVLKTLQEMKSAHLSGAFISLVADAKILAIEPTGVRVARKFEPGEAWQDYQRQMRDLQELLAMAPAKIATKASDLKKLSRQGIVAAFISCEGDNFLEGQLDRVNQMYEDGVRSLQFTHYSPSELGDIQTATPIHNGLSKFGEQVVREMNRLGMLIDVAHATFETTKAVAAISTDPILLSHSILALPDRQVPRAISTEHAKVVVQTGGVIGMWPSGFNNNLEDFIDNTLQMIDLVGIDHVGLGTDMDGNYKPVLSSYLQLSQWKAALRAKGLSDSELQNIMSGNAKRLLKQVL